MYSVILSRINFFFLNSNKLHTMVLQHQEYDTESGVFHKPIQCSHLYFQFMEGSNISGNLTWGKHAGEHLQLNWTAGLRDARTAANNMIWGDYAGQELTTGVGNLLSGMYSGNALTTGSYNIFFGPNIMNTVAGTVLDAPGVLCTTGSRNLGLVTGSLQLLVTGVDNVALGHNSGAFAAAASSNNLYLGSNSGNRAGWTGDYLLCVAAETEAGYDADSELIQGAFTGGACATAGTVAQGGATALNGPVVNVNGCLMERTYNVPMTARVTLTSDAATALIPTTSVPALHYVRVISVVAEGAALNTGDTVVLRNAGGGATLIAWDDADLNLQGGVIETGHFTTWTTGTSAVGVGLEWFNGVIAAGAMELTVLFTIEHV